MTRSKIITEFINEEADVEKTLKRLKALLYNLDSQENLNWVDNELSGYSTDTDLPEYRIVGCMIYGTILGINFQQKDRVLSVSHLSKDAQESLSKKKITEGVKTLKEGAEKDIYYNVPAELHGHLAKWFKQDRYSPIQVVDAYSFVSRTSIIEIISVVEKKILDILLLLEKKFGVLDELDIRIESQSSEAVEKVNQTIFNIIYQTNTTTVVQIEDNSIDIEDNSIDVGDNNRITKSTIETTNRNGGMKLLEKKNADGT